MGNQNLPKVGLQGIEGDLVHMNVIVNFLDGVGDTRFYEIIEH
jgi:hypothetical protein